MSDLTPSERQVADAFEGVTAPSGLDQWRERPARQFAPARPWAGPLAGVLAVALVAGGLGAYFGIRASVGGPAGSSGATPSPRAGGAMAFDTNTGSIVLFGGTGSSGPLHDTWTWDGSSWTQQHPAHSPPATGIGPMAYDPASHDMLLVTVSMPNGTGSISSADPATVNPPPAQTWLWDGADWHPASGVQPPVSALTHLATDSAAGDVVLVATGGVVHPPLGAPCRLQVPTSDPIAAICPGYTQVRTSTWVWNGTSWKDTGAGGPMQKFDEPRCWCRVAGHRPVDRPRRVRREHAQHRPALRHTGRAAASPLALPSAAACERSGGFDWAPDSSSSCFREAAPSAAL